jgi:4-aminobutyrate aminotransferase-like enzyme
MRSTAQILDELRKYESPNITYLVPDGSWPIVWDRARGSHVRDHDGRKYLDLTAAFGVAAAGHANPRVVAAGRKQMSRLLHAMGDVHPHALKADLLRLLSQITFERWTKSGDRWRAKTILCNSGFEAVEAALKTARLATRRAGVIAFQGAYHGLGYGALNATHRPHFRSPFLNQLRQFGHFLPFPPGPTECLSRACAPPRVRVYTLKQVESALDQAFFRISPGAVLVEPVQVRGGINVPDPDFLPLLRRKCDENDALLIFDEIYTGFGRTGAWFACEHWNVTPDLICLGKALTGGFPLSACVGRSDLMDRAWPPSEGEAIHTSTFLGHPVGCAMALAQINEIRQERLVERSRQTGRYLLELLKQLEIPPHLQVSLKAMGLLVGLELCDPNGAPATRLALAIVHRLLHRGYIVLPEGEHSNIIGITPPLTIPRPQLSGFVRALQQVLHEAL